jgi:hypothetical protein
MVVPGWGVIDGGRMQMDGCAALEDLELGKQLEHTLYHGAGLCIPPRYSIGLLSTGDRSRVL